MAAIDRDDLIPPPDETASDDGARPAQVVAFIPIAVALFGVGAILFGGVRATDINDAAEAVVAIDPVVTGTVVAPRDRRRDLEMLDR